jgi:hypothetical protein
MLNTDGAAATYVAKAAISLTRQHEKVLPHVFGLSLHRVSRPCPSVMSGSQGIPCALVTKPSLIPSMHCMPETLQWNLSWKDKGLNTD